MCEHNDTVDLLVPITGAHSYNGRFRMAYKPIDRCIAPIVAALNSGQIFTTGCCCGHYQRPGEILLGDGRILTVADPEPPADSPDSRDSEEAS